MSGAAELFFAGSDHPYMEAMDSPAANTGRTWECVLGSLKEVIDMLVLSRRRDESIVIGDDIRITIVEIRDDKVRLGIETPRDVSVHRSEVYEAIRRHMPPTETIDEMDRFYG